MKKLVKRNMRLPEELTAAERKYLNDYHARVYEIVAPLLDGEDRDWLRHATRAI